MGGRVAANFLSGNPEAWASDSGCGVQAKEADVQSDFFDNRYLECTCHCELGVTKHSRKKVCQMQNCPLFGGECCAAPLGHAHLGARGCETRQ